jgi:hypothetical protein
MLAVVEKEDPNRYRDRTVLPEKGKGKKERPRKKSWNTDDSGSFLFL